jgi:hypothetical protein
LELELGGCGGLAAENLEEVLLRDDQHKTCAICLEDVPSESKVEQLQACKHWFHRACIRKWLDRSPFCPLCRKSGFDLQDWERAMSTAVASVRRGDLQAD